MKLQKLHLRRRSSNCGAAGLQQGGAGKEQGGGEGGGGEAVARNPRLQVGSQRVILQAAGSTFLQQLQLSERKNICTFCGKEFC